MNEWPIVIFTAGIGIIFLLERNIIPKPEAPPLPPLVYRERKFDEFPLWYRALLIAGGFAPLLASLYAMDESKIMGACMLVLLGIFVGAMSR